MGPWDLLIAHPPCTFLTSSSAIRLFNHDGTIKDQEREQKGWNAKKLFLAFLSADCERICVENPTPLKHFQLPRYTQVIEPYFFGDPWKKRTCLWLKGLPQLVATDMVEPKGLWVGSTSGRNKSTGRIKSCYTLSSNRDSKKRSKTFPGIANAMADQWGNMIHLQRKPCPFCGGEAEPELSQDLLSIRAKCKNCGVATGYKSMWWIASDAWNADEFENVQSQISMFD